MSEPNLSEPEPIEEPNAGVTEDLYGAEPLPGQDVLSDDDLADAQAHCPHCLEPITSAHYYCPKCTKPVGQLTGILPLINVPFQAQFYGALWQRLWHEKVGWAERILCAVLVLISWPFMIVIGLAALLWRRTPTENAKRKESGV